MLQLVALLVIFEMDFGPIPKWTMGSIIVVDDGEAVKQLQELEEDNINEIVCSEQDIQTIEIAL